MTFTTFPRASFTQASSPRITSYNVCYTKLLRDLAEALILPGLVVGMAELLAVAEIFVSRNDLRKDGKKKKSKLLEEFTIKETPNMDITFSKMEVLYTAPKFFAFVLVVYGAILSGFTGGAVMASGLLFYVLAKRVIGQKILPEELKA